MVTIEQVNSITYGEEISIGDDLVLYYYCEEDIIVIVRESDWTELYQVLIDGDVVTLEEL